MQDKHGWDLNAEGKINAYPVIGWDLRTARLTGLLRLRYARSETEFEAGGVSLHLHLTPVQLRQLAQDALTLADHIDADTLSTRQ